MRRKEDLEYVERMIIDEERENTPYRITTEEPKEIKYSDHFMITVIFNWMLKIKNNESSRLIMGPKEYQKFREDLKKEKISEIINKEGFHKNYTKWNNKVLEIAEKNKKKRRKRNSGKVSRNLKVAKKKVKKALQDKGIDNEEKKILIKRRDLINEYIEAEEKSKRFATVTKLIDRMKGEGGLNTSTTFWEFRRRLQGRNKEILHTIEDENGNRYENREEIKNIYKKYFQELLKCSKATDEEGKETEDVVGTVIQGLKTLSDIAEIRSIGEEELQKVVSKLKKRKAKDCQNWNNELIIEGGEEIKQSLIKIYNVVNETQEPPREWNQMRIKTIPKKGSNVKMSNKRGLFITNNISKIYEKIIKARNREQIKKGISALQTGGIEGRSTMDNIMVILAIIERNKYLGKSTHVAFADVQKCFDRLWLDDGIKDMWECGMDIRDCITIKNLNRFAEATVDTPAGLTEKIDLENTDRGLSMVLKYVVRQWIKTVNVTVDVNI